jgi:hypothetical protein
VEPLFVCGRYWVQVSAPKPALLRRFLFRFPYLLNEHAGRVAKPSHDQYIPLSLEFK